MNVGLLCSNQGLELAAVISALTSGRLSASVRIVIADRHQSVLNLARSAGLYGVFIPRAPFHANRDGFERRLVELLTQAEVRLVVLAGYERELGPVLNEAFPGRLFGHGLGPEELVSGLAERVGRFTLVSAPKRASEPGDGP
jgi:phosphoribosylglycinamide formyltransferase-1